MQDSFFMLSFVICFVRILGIKVFGYKLLFKKKKKKKKSMILPYNLHPRKRKRNVVIQRLGGDFGEAQ